MDLTQLEADDYMELLSNRAAELESLAKATKDIFNGTFDERKSYRIKLTEDDSDIL